jgi:alkyl hydroperoxide reductase subunit F
MLDDALRTQLKSYLALAKLPIELRMESNDSDASRQMSALLHEIAALSDLITVSESPSVSARAPCFEIAKAGAEARACFAGVPMGHEFTSLVLILLHTAGHPPKITQELAAQIRSLSTPMAFETYYSQSCHNCPDVVQALNLLAALNPLITHTAIDGALFPADIEQRQIMGVPAVFLDGAPFAQGRMGIEEVLAKIDTASSSERSAASLDNRAPFDMLIIGGGPAGAAAAVYGARKGIRVGVLADRFGGQTLDTQGIENFISVKETLGPQFASAMEEHAAHYEVDIMKPFKASSLALPSPAEPLFQIHAEGGGSLRAKTIILATGARWRSMNVPGEDLYRNKGVAYCPHCDGPLFKGKRVAVIGGGNSGVEAAIDLAGLVSHVTLFEYASSLKADSVLQRKLASLPNATVVLNAQSTAVEGDGAKVNALAYIDRSSGQARRLELDGIFVQIGLVPNTEWLPSSIETNSFGEILIDARGHTSVPGIFAAGDATAIPFKQIIIAAGEGAKAALGCFDHMMRS